MAADLWPEDRAILDAICEADRLGDDCHQAIAPVVGHLNEVQLGRRLFALLEARYIDGLTMKNASGGVTVHVQRPLEKARRETGQWPSGDPVEMLRQLLDQRIAAASDDEERTKLERFRDDMYGVGTGVLGGLLTEVVKRMVGMS